MRVIVVYVISLIIGQAASVGVGLLADLHSKAAGVAVFIPIYFAMYWICWRFALWVADDLPAASSEPTDGSGGSRAATASWLLAPAVVALDLCD